MGGKTRLSVNFADELTVACRRLEQRVCINLALFHGTSNVRFIAAMGVALSVTRLLGMDCLTDT